MSTQTIIQLLKLKFATVNQHGAWNETGLASLQPTSSPSSPTQLALIDCTHHRGLPPSTLNDQRYGLFNVHKNKTSEGAVRRDHGFRRYPQNRNVRLFLVSIYTLSDLGDLSDLIGSLSRTIQQYSPPSEWIRDCAIIIRRGGGAEKLELSNKNSDSTPPPKQKN